MAARASDADICVVGAGVMGLSAAWHLCSRGRRVVCLDRSMPGREASGATAGTLAVQNKVLTAVPFVLRALELWAGLSAELEFDVEFETRGGLRVAHTDQDVQKLECSAAAQRAVGAPVEMMYAPRLRRVAPYLSAAIQAAAHCPLDAMANPFAAVRALWRACARARVRFELERAVTGISAKADGTFVVRSDGLEIHAASVLIAAGAWIPKIVQPFGVVLPIVTRVQQVLITDFGPSLFTHVVTHVRENLTLKQQRLSGKVLIGGGWTGDGDLETGARRLTREAIGGNVQIAVDTVPGVASMRLLRAWSGFEGRTPDRLPVLGRVSPLANLYVVGCASGGFTLAPICGRLVAQLITTGRTELPIDEFAVDRFAEASAPGASAAAARI